jgi:hypothetical protein
MKKLILIAVALITVNATAQEDKRERNERPHGDRMERTDFLKDLSPDEIATLQTKKMALHLDLTEAQQKEIHAIHLEQAKVRKTDMETRKKLNEKDKDIRFKRANDQLDTKLAAKSKFKKVLNKEQYEKWERGNTMKGKRKNKSLQKRKQRK